MSTLVTLTSRVCPMNSSAFSTNLSESCERGMKPVTSLYAAITPPFTCLTTFTLITVLFSKASLTSFQCSLISSFFLESRITPSPSSVLITFAWISSPSLNRSVSFWSPSSVTSSLGITPSFLHPMLTITSFSVTWCTFPLTISPTLGSLNDFSISSIKSIMFISLFSVMCSLILAITSLITHSGVEAPAAIPILLHFKRWCNGKSSFFSTKYVFEHIFFEISYNFCVLELFLPPMITIASHSSASFLQLSCLSAVALHMVFFTIYFLFCSSNMLIILSNRFFFIVV